jgi:Ca2+-binding RTX toxin-like protein
VGRAVLGSVIGLSRSTRGFFLIALLAGAAYGVLPAVAGAAITHSFSNGKLQVNGTAAADQITIDCDPGRGGVRLNATVLTPVVPCGDVKAIYAVGEQGDDTLNTVGVSPALGFTGLPAVGVTFGPQTSLMVVGADGNDTVIDGDYSSFLGGEAGDNTITGGGGDDQLAGDGANVGHDVYDGGAGNDRILGSAGPDLLLGGTGKDAIHTFMGNDKALGGPGKDQLDGSYGNDKLFGGSGKDHAAGGPGTDKCVAEQKSNCEL